MIPLTRVLGLKTNIWWRDDDIFETTKELERLLHLSKTMDIPAHLSVIPKSLNSDTIELIKSYSNIKVLQHGYSHLNYAKKGAPLNEFGLDRDIDIMLDEIRLGFNKLTDVFNKQFLPIFVPPWGHIAMPVIKCLHEIGFIGISLIGDNEFVYPRLKNMNVQIDIHSWKTESETSYDVSVKSFETIMDNFIKLLSLKKSKQNGYFNIGVLTHSQIMQEDDWEIFTNFILAIKEFGVEIIDGNRIPRRED